MKKSKEFEEDKRVVFTGPGDKFSAHGIEMERGIVYPVSHDVFEYLKAFRGVYEITQIKLSKLDFPKKIEKVM